MPILIGTDEAGYGPNLGPLVVTATTWTLPDEMQPGDLWAVLSEILTDTPARADKRLHVADSKKVYSAGKSMARLETAVLAFLRYLRIRCDTVGELGAALSGDSFEQDYAAVCRGVVEEQVLPVVSTPEDCHEAADAIEKTLAAAKVELAHVESRIIFPPEFNRGVEEYDSKGKVLSDATLSLVRKGTEQPGVSDGGWIFCDKHGGRNRYDDIISATFDNQFVFRLEESRPASRYRLGELEFCFRTKAEELLPVALASMIAKYVREVVMMQINRFWQHHLPELKPTKGYPVDAKRFWSDIEDKCIELNIARADVWRCR